VLFWGSWKIPVFYSVIETRDFSLFNQSAQALLKGYFINEYMDQDLDMKKID
jgi:hypothetical protein